MRIPLMALALGLLMVSPASADWDFSRATIPVDEIRRGGPPKDGIPALVDPETTDPKKAAYLSDDDPVLGLVVGGKARAYPIRILSWHELVNDRLGGKPVLVSW